MCKCASFTLIKNKFSWVKSSYDRVCGFNSEFCDLLYGDQGSKVQNGFDGPVWDGNPEQVRVQLLYLLFSPSQGHNPQQQKLDSSFVQIHSAHKAQRYTRGQETLDSTWKVWWAKNFYKTWFLCIDPYRHVKFFILFQFQVLQYICVYKILNSYRGKKQPIQTFRSNNLF